MELIPQSSRREPSPLIVPIPTYSVTGNSSAKPVRKPRSPGLSRSQNKQPRQHSSACGPKLVNGCPPNFRTTLLNLVSQDVSVRALFSTWNFGAELVHRQFKELLCYHSQIFRYIVAVIGDERESIAKKGPDDLRSLLDTSVIIATFQIYLLTAALFLVSLSLSVEGRSLR